MTIEQLYRNYFAYNNSSGNASKECEDAFHLLAQMHWYSNVVEFDPLTAEALPLPLSEVLHKAPVDNVFVKDRLWRIVEHVRMPLITLFRELNESPRREQDILPLRAVRELDTSSFMALSRRPGRNIREKLAGRPYMQAVRHFQSVDLPENRLLKAFCERLAELLELRERYLEEKPTEGAPIELLLEIRAWLETDEAQGIGRWENLPPNNTLLTHRYYRALYDSWCWLQTLDDDLTRDFEHVDERQATMEKWIEYRAEYASGGDLTAASSYLFADMPVFFDYDKYEIRPWTKEPLVVKVGGYFHHGAPERISAPVCIDLTELYPTYAVLTDDNPDGEVASNSRGHLPEPFLWQQWRNADSGESVDIELFKADALYLHPDATTISVVDLFFPDRKIDDALARKAAWSFAAKLHATFPDKKLFWLTPDFLSDFELEIIRRSLNACFSEAEPLPRSVAAVFEKIDYSQIREGFAVVVVDSVGGTQCATKLEARFHEDLKACLPETCGFYWERHPPVVFSRKKAAEEDVSPSAAYDIATLDEYGNLHDPARPEQVEFISLRQLQQNKFIGVDASGKPARFKVINISESPVSGAIRLHALQKRAGAIPLWCDQIPALAIKARMQGQYRFFTLVSPRSTTVKPVRGHAVQIPIEGFFSLPRRRNRLILPLIIGENEEELGFSAKLESPAFPLKEELKCKLELKFTYGADDPYSLVFKPVNPSFSPIRAHWERGGEEIITDAVAPKYPEPVNWAYLQNFPRKDGNGFRDLLDWAQNSVGALNKKLHEKPEERKVGQITSFWHEDKNGNHYTFVTCDDLDDNVFIHENEFLPSWDYSSFEEDDYVSFLLVQKNGKYSGKRVAAQNYVEDESQFDAKKEKEIVSSIHKSLYFPIIQIWRDTRSLNDRLCPSTFRNRMENVILQWDRLLVQDDIPETVKDEIFFLLACMHKNAPRECVELIKRQIENDKIKNKQAIGFSLGDLSKPWQKQSFLYLAEHPTHDAVRVFAYAIWREQHFVERFNLSELNRILEVLMEMLEHVKPLTDLKAKDKEPSLFLKRIWNRKTVEPLEFLLGLLRTRDSNSKEIHDLLQPYQKITKEFAKQVDRIAGIVADTRFDLFSRVQLGNLPPKPENDNTPDLLFALRLYLTGDDGSNAIEITGISEDDTD